MTPRLALLLLALCLPTLSLPTRASDAPAPVAGVDYVEIDGGQPYLPLAGRIEVAEVFGYGCHHCADFAPKLEAWQHTLPKRVRVSYVPVAYHLDDPFARAYFAAEAAGALGKTHAAMFRAIHAEQTLPKNASLDEIVAFYAERGVDVARIRGALQDPALDAKLEHARAFAVASGIEGTPTLIINGRYRVRGRTLDDTLRIASQLIASQLLARPGAPGR
jgi:thiol:disulfide interchange protein DsbA